MKQGELVYWLEREREETESDGGLRSNFLGLLSVPKQGKSARSLYPSLGNDSDANGALSNAMKALEEMG